MAYYGGMNQERPWPRINVQVIVLAALAVIFLGILGMGLVSAGNSTESGGIFASLFGAGKAKEQEAPAAPQRPAYVHDVLVATESVKPGKRLEPGMFRTESRDVRGVETKVVHDFMEVENLYTTTMLVSGSPLLMDQVSSVAPVNAITAAIPEGFRAVAIPINAETGVEGWVRPGAKVDVVWISSLRGRPLVSTIVENAEVLSAERSTERNQAPNASQKPVPSHVTLLLTVKDAQRVQLAKTSGSLSLSLRGDEDGSAIGSGTLTIDKLLRRSDLEAVEEVQGEVEFDGQKFALKGGTLVKASKEEPATAPAGPQQGEAKEKRG